MSDNVDPAALLAEKQAPSVIAKPEAPGAVEDVDVVGEGS